MTLCSRSLMATALCRIGSAAMDPAPITEPMQIHEELHGMDSILKEILHLWDYDAIENPDALGYSLLVRKKLVELAACAVRAGAAIDALEDAIIAKKQDALQEAAS